jgi:hypothetical protein
MGENIGVVEPGMVELTSTSISEEEALDAVSEGKAGRTDMEEGPGL